VSARRPRLALTCGEPAGIGPDLAVLLAAHPPPASTGYDITCLGDRLLLSERARQLGLPEPGGPHFEIEHLPLPATATPGRLDTRNARWVLDLLDRDIDGCRDGRFDAIVTAPVQKSIINDAGIPFTGHTEYLAQRCGDVHPVMLLAGGGLRVALATTHLPLADVSRHLTPALLDRTLRILDHDLRRHWGLAQPRIGVCGLNPHAGEGGHLGREEIDVIAPAIAAAQQAGIAASGPWPADTIFTPRQLQHFDVVLTMFHDQGLPTLKHAAFGEAVNVTLGLPLLRTSVDHGTALDLAGSGRADVGSLAAAVRLAADLAAQRTQAARQPPT
jgi:4-hydroxythreonine-4-phosphate dehydrogenase